MRLADDLVKRNSVKITTVPFNGSSTVILATAVARSSENWLKQRRGQVDGLLVVAESAMRPTNSKLRGADNRKNWQSLDVSPGPLSRAPLAGSLQSTIET
jgi:hypothetical protein